MTPTGRVASLLARFQRSLTVLPTCLALAITVTLFTAQKVYNRYVIEFEFHTSQSGYIELDYDLGNGFVSPLRKRSFLRHNGAPVRCSFDLPPGTYTAFRIKPRGLQNEITLMRARILRRSGEVIREFPVSSGVDHDTDSPPGLLVRQDTTIAFSPPELLPKPFSAADKAGLAGVFMLAFLLAAVGHVTCATYRNWHRKITPSSSTVVSAIVLIVLGYCVVSGGIFERHRSSLNLWGYIFESAPQPQLGVIRPSLTDEINNFTPSILHQIFRREPFSVRETAWGTENVALLFALPVKHPTTLLRPQFWPYFILSPERAFAFVWHLKSALLLLGVFSLLFFLTKNTAISLLGSIWYYFSAYTSWWITNPVSLQERVGLACFVVVSFCGIWTA